ncbi:MAG: secretin N-terminal domain-containing protein [Opitutaceae bacterium]
MKTTHLTPAVWLGIAALTASALAQPTPTVPTVPNPGTPPATTPGGRNQGRGGPGGRSGVAATPAPAAATVKALNFRNAPLEAFVNYMAEEAGFAIQFDTAIRGTVDAYSAQPVTRDEALELFNLALNKNGYTSVVQGRIITIASKDDAKKKNLPIRTSNDADEIPNTAEMYIQIIPLRRLDATAAARDLGTMLPGSSTITANADSNSLLVTDTNINLKQVVRLVNALDTSTDSISTMRIFDLKNADPVEMAQLITSLYSTTGQAQAGRGGGGGGAANQLAAAFGGFGGVGGFGGAGGGGRGGGGGGGGAGGGRGGRGGGATNRNVPVVAVAYPAGLRVIVTASKEQMPDIIEMVTQLDSNPGRKQQAFIYTLENANPRQVETLLKTLVPQTRAANTQNQQDDALQLRATANARATNTTTPTTGGTTGNTTGR